MKFSLNFTISKIVAIMILAFSVMLESLIPESHGAIYINSLWAVTVLLSGKNAADAFMGKNTNKKLLD